MCSIFLFLNTWNTFFEQDQLVFVDMKHFFMQHYFVFVETRLPFAQHQNFFSTQNCLSWNTKFLLWTLFRMLCHGDMMCHDDHVATKIESRVKKNKISFLHDTKKVIHGFTMVLILPVFRQLLLRNRKMSCKSLFWNERTQRTVSRNNSKLTSQALQLTLVLYIFKLVLYFNLIIVSNEIKYYLAINRGNFLQIRYGFHRHNFQIHSQLAMSDGLLLKEHVPRNQGS